MCERAVLCGLAGIAFTDHCEVDTGLEACLDVVRGLKSDVSRARDIFGERLEISLGVELGEPHHNPPFARELTRDPEIDFVIGSLHHARGQPDYYYIDYGHENLDAIMSLYYEELEELVECGCFDVVGHINYQLRYMDSLTRSRANPSKYYGKLGEILRAIASKNLGIEINTSGLWRGMDFTLPSLDVLKMFRAAGGKVVTTGSDSHDSSHVGAELKTAVEYMRTAGFKYLAFFKNREPSFKPI
jgi:histidinol-phosphatase (PHP family)